MSIRVQIDPEVANSLGLSARDRPRQRDENGHSSGSRDEVLHGEADHLRQIAESRFARIALPIGIGRKADGSVPRQIRRRRWESLWIERQQSLEPLNEVNKQDAHDVKEQHRGRVGRPSHLAFFGSIRNATTAIDGALQPAEDAVEEQGTSFVDVRHVFSERLRQHEEHDEEENYLSDPLPAHEKASGLRSATNKYTRRAAERIPPMTYRMGILRLLYTRSQRIAKPQVAAKSRAVSPKYRKSEAMRAPPQDGGCRTNATTRP